MQAFPQKTTDYIAEQFKAYFIRKEHSGYTLREARTLIDYASGPVPSPQGSTAIDLTKPIITGGGKVRPSKMDVDRIVDRHAIDIDDALWNAVFDELIQSLKDGMLEGFKDKENAKALRLIKLAFKYCKKREEICDLMHMKSTKTYNNYRLAILATAGIFAIKKGLDIV